MIIRQAVKEVSTEEVVLTEEEEDVLTQEEVVFPEAVATQEVEEVELVKLKENLQTFI
jgi:hypothetical protein